MKFRHFLLVAGLTSLTAGLVQAHHSLAAEYDQSKKITLHGTLTSIDWRNPHAWIYLDVKDESGAVVKWQCELGSPNAMTRQGWTQDAAKAGDELVLDGIMAKDSSKTCSTRNVKFKDGRNLWSQSQGPDGRN
jgi:hypothetical protein